MSLSPTSTRRYAGAGALLLSGLVAGGVLAGSLSANAASPSPSPSASSSTAAGSQQHAPETPLTGDTLTKVKAAVSAKYPGATFDRVETDSETGAYEAHITKKDGTHAIVLVSKAFAVTGEQTGGPGMGGFGHGRGGPGAGETALTGTTLSKVKAAVLAEYPGATFMRVETDAETGAYEAHITKADGSHVEVLVSKAFAVTGEETHQGPPPGAPAAGTQTS